MSKKKKALLAAVISVIAVALIILGLYLNDSYTTVGFCFINEVSTNEGEYYICVPREDITVKVYCNKSEHQLVKENLGSFFYIEYVSNNHHPERGRLTYIEIKNFSDYIA